MAVQNLTYTPLNGTMANFSWLEDPNIGGWLFNNPLSPASCSIASDVDISALWLGCQVLLESYFNVLIAECNTDMHCAFSSSEAYRSQGLSDFRLSQWAKVNSFLINLPIYNENSRLQWS